MASRFGVSGKGKGFDVAILLGSKSDKKLLEDSGAFEILDSLGISYHSSVCSAHRNPRELACFCLEVISMTKPKVIMAAAGMAAGLPGAIAGATNQWLPIIGVALDCGFLGGLDALLSICRMPKGVPVMCSGIGIAGFVNAAIAAGQILATGDESIAERLHSYLNETATKPEFGYRTSSKEVETAK